MMSEKTVTYKVNDYVYVELGNNKDPVWVARIDEMQEVNEPPFIQIKLKMFYRRLHIPDHLLTIADKYMDCHISGEEFLWEFADDETYKTNYTKLHYKLLQRQLFITKEFIVVSPDVLCGKCMVSILTVVDSPMSVLRKANHFFYALNYDATEQKLCEERCNILVGSEYQAVIPPYQGKKQCNKKIKEDLMWCPGKLDSSKIDQHEVISKSIRASKRRQCNIEPCSIGVLYRDQYKLYDLTTLHDNNYNVNAAAQSLIQQPIKHLDDLENWSGVEIDIFERALALFHKNFSYIRKEFLPWKSHSQIVRFYYQWKCTPRYKSWTIKNGSSSEELKHLEVELKPFRFAWLRETSTENRIQKCGSCSKHIITGDKNTVEWGSVPWKGVVCVNCADHWKRYAGFNYSNQLFNGSPRTFIPISNLRSHDRPIRCNSKGCRRSFKTKQALKTHQDAFHDEASCKVFVVTASIKSMRRDAGIRRVRRIARKPYVIPPGLK